MNNVSNPVAMITGSSRGIGAACAVRLGTSGYRVVINYLNNRDAALEVANDIRNQGGIAEICQADVGKQQGREILRNFTIESFGSVDVLVNNAGITSQGRRDILEATEESWDLVFDTNLKGPFVLSQLIAKDMIGQQRVRPGVIININSISSYAISNNRADYCIAKTGLRTLTELFANRLAEENVLVYEVCPGVIASDMTAPVKEKYDTLIEQGLSPIKRWGKPDDVATAVRLLARGELTFTTGQRINVDGGFHIRRL